MERISLSQILDCQALRARVPLEPIDGPDGRIFPPTYADGGNHVIETLPDGTKRALVDSVASQANRQEAALVAARHAGEINFADVYVDLSDTKTTVAELSATEMPHRLSDAILRDSEIDGVAFAESVAGKGVATANHNDLSVLLEMSPTTVLYGAWFSGWNTEPALKIQRSVVSEIWADNVVPGLTVGGRSDPLGIESIPIYATDNGSWTAVEAQASRDNKKKPVLFKKASQLKHGQIPPNVREQGITAETVTLRWALSMAAVRRLRFGGDERDKAGQAYLAALAILARVLDHDQGYALRSRCDLISRGPVKIELIGRDGEITEHVVGKSEAIALFEDAAGRMTTAGLSVNKRIEAKPSKKLVDLIAENAAHQAAGESVGDEG